MELLFLALKAVLEARYTFLFCSLGVCCCLIDYKSTKIFGIFSMKSSMTGCKQEVRSQNRRRRRHAEIGTRSSARSSASFGVAIAHRSGSWHRSFCGESRAAAGMQLLHRISCVIKSFLRFKTAKRFGK